MNGLVQILSARYSTEQIVWARAASHFVFILALFVPAVGVAVVRTTTPKWQVIRSMVHLMSMLFFFTGVKYLPLGEGRLHQLHGAVLRRPAGLADAGRAHDPQPACRHHRGLPGRAGHHPPRHRRVPVGLALHAGQRHLLCAVSNPHAPGRRATTRPRPRRSTARWSAPWSCRSSRRSCGRRSRRGPMPGCCSRSASSAARRTTSSPAP